MSFKSIIVEIRPLLQSVNFLVKLIAKEPKVNVELKDETVKLIINEIPYDIKLENLEILHDSVQNLQIIDKCLTFRIATNNKNKIGSFKTELLQMTGNKNSSKNKGKIPKIDDYSIYCKNCCNEFVSLTGFERTLPLPSEDCAPDDWFCHKVDKSLNLSPKLKDLFYSQCFIHVNSKLFKGIACAENILKCDSCNSWIGIALPDGTYKIWYNTATLKCVKQNFGSDPLQDVFLTLRCLQNNCLTIPNRYVFQCPILQGETCYLLLWIVEKLLVIHLYDENDEMKRHKPCKVLYKMQHEETEELKTWRNLVDVPITLISKCMLDDLVQHLDDMKQFIPDNFQETNNFYVSYLLMHEE